MTSRTPATHGDGVLRAPDGVRVVAPAPLRPGSRLGVVASRFHSEVVQRLVDGALAEAAARGVGAELIQAPGALELPVVAQGAARSQRYVALVALACVLRGETAHFEHVGHFAHEGLLRVSLESGLPIGMAVLTCENAEQAWARAGGHDGNKGAEAAAAALDALGVVRGLTG